MLQQKMVYETVYRGISEQAAGFIYDGFKKSFGTYLISKAGGSKQGLFMPARNMP